MIQILAAIFWLLFVPFGCGTVITAKLSKERHTFGQIFLNGYLVMMALFHCLYLVFLLLGSTNFKLLTIVYSCLILVFAVVSLIRGHGLVRNCRQDFCNREALFLRIVFWFMVALQLGMRLTQQISDGDDAFYIATATAAVDSNTMNLIQPYTGVVTPDLDVRHAFSSGPVFLAYLSKVTMIHPAAMAHSVLSLILIVLHYLVVLGMAKVLFPDKKKEQYLLGIVVCLFNVYGFVSIYTAQTFLLTRTWQGKSMFANLFIPAVFLLLLWMASVKKKDKIPGVYYTVAGIILFGATSTTTLATIVTPFLFMTGALFLAIYHKKFSILLKSALACIPAGIVGILYFLS